jgi:hypothetical protein
MESGRLERGPKGRLETRPGGKEHYRRVEVMPAHPHTYIVPNGGTYYYDDDTYFYKEGERD